MRPRTIIAAVLLLLLTLGVLTTAYILFIHAPMKLAEAAAAGIKETFNFTPRITINQTVVIEQNTPIMEIATVARQVHVDHAWSHQWLGSTKSLRVTGSFTAKAGFDLRQPFTIDIARNPLRVTATMPPPQLLSLTMDTYRVEADDSGWWNRISSADREAAVLDLQAAARTRAETSGILEEARRTIEDRIREVAEKNGARVEFLSAPAGVRP
jgi:hypothetical protein